MSCAEGCCNSGRAADLRRTFLVDRRRLLIGLALAASDGLGRPLYVSQMRQPWKDVLQVNALAAVYNLSSVDADGKLKSRAAGEFGIGVLTGALEKMFPVQAAEAQA